MRERTLRDDVVGHAIRLEVSPGSCPLLARLHARLTEITPDYGLEHEAIGAQYVINLWVSMLCTEHHGATTRAAEGSTE